MGLGLGVAIGGLVLAYHLDLAAGGAIVLLAVLVYLGTLAAGPRGGVRSAPRI
jgi:ABC-type Mn2+/Zn2+ transport system permease subunit